MFVEGSESFQEAVDRELSLRIKNQKSNKDYALNRKRFVIDRAGLLFVKSNIESLYLHKESNSPMYSDVINISCEVNNENIIMKEIIGLNSDDNENIEASLLLDIYNFEDMKKLQKLLSNKFSSLRFDFVDNESF